MIWLNDIDKFSEYSNNYSNNSYKIIGYHEESVFVGIYGCEVTKDIPAETVLLEILEYLYISPQSIIKKELGLDNLLAIHEFKVDVYGE